jgi:hypothetical protein
MRKTATPDDDIIADMRELADRIQEAIRDRPPDATGLNLLAVMNSLNYYVYGHEIELRLSEIMRLADNFGQAAS